MSWIRENILFGRLRQVFWLFRPCILPGSLLNQWNIVVKARLVKGFTAAGLFGICTRFPFHLPDWIARSNTWTTTKIYLFEELSKPFFCIYFSIFDFSFSPKFVLITKKLHPLFGKSLIKSSIFRNSPDSFRLEMICEKFIQKYFLLFALFFFQAKLCPYSFMIRRPCI